MEKEYVSTVVIDSEAAAQDWQEPDVPSRPAVTPEADCHHVSEPEFTGVHTWVS